MLCPAWLLAVAVVGVVRGVKGQCWENPRCHDLSSENNLLECIQLCRSDLTTKSPIFPVKVHLQPPSPSDSDSPPLYLPLSLLSPSSPLYPTEQQNSVSPQAKRSYSMEHFRWGKPVGRKRRPVKVYTNGVEEESSEAFPSEMRRELGTDDAVYPSLEAGTAEGGEAEGMEGVFSLQEKKDGSYKMNHFRWSGPPASKRYGGFMKSWDERSQKPLLTLFKNVIIKDGQQKREQWGREEGEEKRALGERKYHFQG
ncbi:pro-opiomelanocortin A precursor [Oncorhynchus mykiss]|uniref:Pro-opiomelanocortin A n=1 Tax=Oncorhynchus mykiss TaxID=8022 RepID=COLI1_ONCMY|nr:pro-opiomelanocortin A precursor [Oncorhynchus mykiss]Q04617.1 RecName: Full=Pro-opiomelanocortin A; Short=POMC-A; AltName: Full=Corticotropin-lipotropin A; Contains: RecName: Full=NPP 1; Contains: RecName: Full=Corticotropin; AltName: Full=Adrenocorticotropic hormone; Short=ACTH; Contains: RecName: Full=Melanocyte-stimulating hormone alpha 1; Short=Alpha-MSH 1; AltName: Full=Melanotropin alpha 1; Contains: RecName: Full=Corticotropin-like intermediary peptide 1; Short=CLIP-1; Contains: RecName